MKRVLVIDSHVLHGLFKQHQVHVRVKFIVMLQSVHQRLLKLLQVCHPSVPRFTRTVSEVRVDQWLVDEDRLIDALRRQREPYSLQVT